jgi:hypothetical protein
MKSKIDQIVDQLLDEKHETDVGEKVKFSADSFQMPFDVPDEKEHVYKGVITAQRGYGPEGALTVKLTSPSFASGKIMKVSRGEETLEILRKEE